ncbi:xyloglucan endotransglucosylase/hydrolase protein 33 precursor [Hibiscus syriacus]|uniref:Xyloglucan endotransglucosylase/hydrolase protein 33 n=1 Tax=Hibiscus syriacus TaxID=106335 RepID=A0A6A2Z132_HIBSY|nr:xyloglucan endotransglucosylase/hydrolase protein 33 precursor [Hibiscus syriacus]
MDDSCAVCADNLEWVAFGTCGHRDVCSTCVARLRFLCNERSFCICKTESNVIFVTKALGDYTRNISDLSVFPSQAREGRTGLYWYHEDTQAFFDDVDHYKVIKAMCRLSCNVCDQSRDRVKRQGNFRNIEHLKGHLFHMHRLIMCSLCLEGRKVFISEQKLYSRAQLDRHIKNGDSEVDGTESERGGFMGHPNCEFCKTPFYGESELCLHLSTEHYTCHICQRLHPGQHKYYKKYDNLEARRLLYHYRCEDEACLAKKFIVFLSVAELKRHNTIAHGGRMSRAQRNDALQLPTSFKNRLSNEDNGYGRETNFRPQLYDNGYQLSMVTEASLGTANVPSASSTVQVVCTQGGTNNIDPLVQPFESLSTMYSESSSTYLRAMGAGSRGAPFQESSFSYLPMVPENNTEEAHQRCQKNRKKKNSSQAWVATSCRPMEASSSSSQNGKTTNIADASSVVTGNEAAQTSYMSSNHAKAPTQPATEGILIKSSSQTSSGNASRISQSSSTPNLANGGYLESESNVPATHRQKPSSRSRVLRIVQEVHTTNKSLAKKVLSYS